MSDSEQIWKFRVKALRDALRMVRGLVADNSDAIGLIDAALGARFYDPQTATAFSRTAIGTMREPTSAMVAAAMEHTADPCQQKNVREALRAAIDAALQEGGEG